MVYFRLLASSLSEYAFTLRGSGDALRDFTYIDDVTSVVERLMLDLESQTKSFYDVVNVGGGNPHSINELIQMIKKTTKSDFSIDRVDADKSDVNVTKADFSYLQSLINFRPKTSLEVGIQHCYEWAKKTEVSSNLESWARSVD
jgi:UDP-glucuronate 4-epimerase